MSMTQEYKPTAAGIEFILRQDNKILQRMNDSKQEELRYIHKLLRLNQEYLQDLLELWRESYELNNEADQMQQDFNDAIDFAIDDDDPKAFLRCWREGDWEALSEEWPDFKLPTIAYEGEPRK